MPWPLAVALSVLAVVWIYAAILSTWTLTRDETLTLAGKLVRMLLAWLLPLAGSVYVLRSAADVSPSSLPPRPFLIPLRPLMYVGPRPRSDLASQQADDRLVGVSTRDPNGPSND